MASQKYCLTHTTVFAKTFCRKCHRPICEECIVQGEKDPFCSNLCLSDFQKFQVAYRSNSLYKKPFLVRLFRGLFGIALLFLVLEVGVYYGKEYVPALKTFDYLEPYLKKILP